MDFNIFTIFYNKGKEYGLPISVWYPIVKTESGGDPAAIGDHGTSFGLLQINKPANPTFDITKYTDPSYQADFQFPELVKFYKEGTGKGLSGLELTKYVERYGQRPEWTTTVENKIMEEYNNLMSFNTSKGSVTPPGLPDGITIPVVSNVGDKIKEGVNSLNPINFAKDIATKAAFFIPAMILLALGAYLLFFGSVEDIKKNL